MVAAICLLHHFVQLKIVGPRAQAEACKASASDSAPHVTVQYTSMIPRTGEFVFMTTEMGGRGNGVVCYHLVCSDVFFASTSSRKDSESSFFMCSNKLSIYYVVIHTYKELFP